MPNEYKSFDDKTGMLGDIEEVREIGVRLAKFIQRMLMHPVLSMFIPKGTVIDAATFSLSVESMLRPMTQAEYYRTLGGVIGIDPLAVEAEIKRYALSEVYPLSHPNAVVMDLPPLDPNDPFVKSSVVLSAIAEDQAKNPRAAEPEAHVELSAELEQFLSGLWKEGPHDADEGTTGNSPG